MLKNPKHYLFDTKYLIGETAPAWEGDTGFLDIYHDIRQYTLVSPARLYAIFQFARQANTLPGDFAQVGVYKGGSAKLIASQKTRKKNFYLFDTFKGLPKTDPACDCYKKGRFADTSKCAVERLFLKSENVDITEGLFPACAKPHHKSSEYAFVYLDVDIYKSNYEALSFFYPRMAKGGYIIIDDYGWTNTPGIKKSVRDFLRERRINSSPIVTVKYQCLLIKT